MLLLQLLLLVPIMRRDWLEHVAGFKTGPLQLQLCLRLRLPLRLQLLWRWGRGRRG